MNNTNNTNNNNNDQVNDIDDGLIWVVASFATAAAIVGTALIMEKVTGLK